jgi:hypothetical protein
MHHLTTLPAELILKIYECLPSFVDALALSTTCRNVRSLWVNHRPTILGEVLPRQFECYSDARRLLGKQRGLEWNGQDRHELDMRDLRLLVQNAERVREAIVDIERTSIPVLRGELCEHAWGLHSAVLSLSGKMKADHIIRCGTVGRERVPRLRYRYLAFGRLDPYGKSEGLSGVLPGYASYAVRRRRYLRGDRVDVFAESFLRQRDGALDVDPLCGLVSYLREKSVGEGNQQCVSRAVWVRGAGVAGLTGFRAAGCAVSYLGLLAGDSGGNSLWRGGRGWGS